MKNRVEISYLHDERTDILCDEVEQEIVAELLDIRMVGVVEGARDDVLFDHTGGSGVDDLDAEIVREQGADSVDQPSSGHGGKEHKPKFFYIY